MKLKDYIGEATSYDKKMMLERKDPTSWLKSVSAFANTQGGNNALIHRDYLELGSEVHVDIYDDRMEITSPGGMPSGHCVRDLDARQVTSKRRNPVIADLFQRLGLMERRSSGFKKILDAYAFESEKRGESVIPRFESTQTDFFLILPNLNFGRKINGVESSSEHLDVGDTQNSPVNPPVNPPGKDVRATFTKRARAVLAALESDSLMTYDTLAAKLKLHRDTIRVSITSLVMTNLLRRVGPDKGGHWEVVK